MSKNEVGHLRPLRNFVAGLYETLDRTGDLDVDDNAWFVSREGEGTIWLDSHEREEYVRMVQTLMKRYGSKEPLSRRTVDAALQDALFAAFGREEDDAPPFTERLEAALEALDARLDRSGVRFTCFIPIGGAGTSGLPFVFGQFRFVVFNEHQLRKFREATRDHQVSQDQLGFRMMILRDIRESTLWESACAVQNVTAKDAEAARVLVEQNLHATLDILNFFSDLTPYQHGRLYILGERASARLVAATLAETGSWTFPRDQVGPLLPFDFRKLRDHKPIQPYFRRVHQMLRTEDRTQVDELLLSALRWAGRAACEPRKEQAFLWYAIAIESAILPLESSELTYRLSLRTAHLLEKRPSSRADIVKRVRDSYGIRSKIIHDGWYDVGDHELESIRRLAKAVLGKLLHEPQVRRIESRKRLHDWYEARIRA